MYYTARIIANATAARPCLSLSPPCVPFGLAFFSYLCVLACFLIFCPSRMRCCLPLICGITRAHKGRQRGKVRFPFTRPLPRLLLRSAERKWRRFVNLSFVVTFPSSLCSSLIFGRGEERKWENIQNHENTIEVSLQFLLPGGLTYLFKIFKFVIKYIPPQNDKALIHIDLRLGFTVTD